MNVDIAHLQMLATDISERLASVATGSTGNSVALQRAMADVEVLFKAVQGSPALWHGTAVSTIEALEQQYGRALGRIIAAVGGLPLSEHARSTTLVRLLATDPSARARLLTLDPVQDAALFETILELFLIEKPTATQVPGATGALYTTAVAAERRKYALPSRLPTPAPDIEPELHDADEEEPEHHVDRVRPVDPGSKTPKR